MNDVQPQFCRYLLSCKGFWIHHWDFTNHNVKWPGMRYIPTLSTYFLFHETLLQLVFTSLLLVMLEMLGMWRCWACGDAGHITSAHYTPHAALNLPYLPQNSSGDNWYTNYSGNTRSHAFTSHGEGYCTKWRRKKGEKVRWKIGRESMWEKRDGKG